MKATYDESITMDKLLLEVRAELAQAEQVQAGRLARLTIYDEDGGMRCFIVPFRVAAYARKAMGVPAVLQLGARVLFSSKGITVAFYPTEFGLEGIRATILAHRCALIRRIEREHTIRKAVIKAKIKSLEAQIEADKLKKGGAAL